MSEEFEPSEHPNLQLDAYLAARRATPELIGVAVQNKRFMGFSLSDLLASPRPGLFAPGMQPAEGPVEHINIPLDEGKVLTCIQFGLILIGDPG